MNRNSYRRAVILCALAAMLTAGAVPAIAADEPTQTWRRYDERGRFAGTARQVDEGRVRFYDEKGRFAGTAWRQRNGSWRTYDGKGAFRGTAKEAR